MRDRRDETTYFPVRCFGRLGAGVTNIKKGTRLFVAGELEIGRFTGEDGNWRMMFNVVADTYRILSNGRRLEAVHED